MSLSADSFSQPVIYGSHEPAPVGHRLPKHWETALFALGMALIGAVLCLLTIRVLDGLGMGGRGPKTNGIGRVAMVTVALVALFSSSRWCVLLLLAFVARRRQLQTPSTYHGEWPFVSIFVPSYNESATIEAALDSLIALDYPRYEILVVNDGSTDDTLGRARQFEGRYGGCAVRVIDKQNGGKWSAHNMAFQHSTGELILCIDADCRIDPQALRTLVARMADPTVDAIAGQMRVRNRDRLLTWLQALEYLIGNGSIRMGQGLFGTVLIVPGPIGMFRRSVLEEVWLRYSHRNEAGELQAVPGPYEGDTFAEDFDLALAVLSLGGKIVYEPVAVCLTKAPETPFALISQRYRWIRGGLQVLRKFARRARQDPRMLSPRVLGWLIATFAVDVTFLPLIHYLGLASGLVFLATGGEMSLIFGIYAAVLVAHASMAAWFVSLHNDSWKLLSVLPVYGLYTGFLVSSAWLISVIDEFRGGRMRW